MAADILKNRRDRAIDPLHPGNVHRAGQRRVAIVQSVDVGEEKHALRPRREQRPE